jgi:hypothetical protein
MLALVVLTGISAWFSSIQFAQDLRTTMMGAWAAHPLFYNFPVWAGFFALAAVHSHLALQRSPGKEAPPKGPLVIVVILTFSAISLALLGSRALFLSFLLSLLLYRHYYFRPLRPWMQAFLLVTLVLVGGYFGIIQKIDTVVGKTAQELPFPYNIAYRLSSSYEQFENLLNVINLNPPLEWGRTFIEDIFVPFIPRSVWPEKPLVYGMLRAQNVLFEDYWHESTDTTYPIGILAELYLNFGMVGIFGGMFGIGAVLARMRVAATMESPYAAILCVLAGTFISPQRTFGSILMSICLYMFYYWGVSTLTRLLTRRDVMART